MDKLSLERASWCVVYTKPRQEFRALEELQNQDYSCFLPTFTKQRVRRANVEDYVEPLFTRYLFIRLDATRDRWAPVQSTRGVSRLVSFGGRFATVPEAFVEALRWSSHQSSHHIRQNVFTAGQQVVVTTGPFAGLEGFYCEPYGEARALVLMELLSSPQKLVFAMELLRKAA